VHLGIFFMACMPVLASILILINRPPEQS
jgi:hypothetical protein